MWRTRMFEQLSFLNKPIITNGMFTSASDEWETPQWLFDRLDNVFHFTLDVCASEQNAKCARYFTKEQDGLAQDWTGEIVWCNPPYGKAQKDWIRKCYEFSKQGGTAVMLVPARTDTAVFHDYIYEKAQIIFLRGRLHFSNAKWNAPFPSMVVIYGGERR